MKLSVVLFVSSVIALSAGAHVDLQAKYPFSVVLLDSGDEYYGLHWNFTRSTESIYFAVNVSTTGWIGFGLSPNGQMPGSDVVIGWVADGDSYFHDRYAEARRLPVIDSVSQDWFLLNSEQTDGFTVLEFSRNFTSCDPQDLDITSSTARVVWSYSELDPTDPTGAGAMEHDQRGSRSINFIGGLVGEANPALGDQEFFDVKVSNVEIPSASTTYWCASLRLPDELMNTTFFINRLSPIITPNARAFVHHLLVYLCQYELSQSEMNVSAQCSEAPSAVRMCRNQLLIGGWAVGGEDFVYPEGVALPIGGIGQEHFVVMEMHYDNPNNMEDVRDSSGLRFYYTNQEPTHRAGILFLGHGVTETMAIPPRTSNFTIAGLCSSTCTNRFIPEGGIRIFADILHTHLAGRGLTIEHYRQNTECDVLEQLEPVDQNNNYDFNYQQFVHLPKEQLVLPGDILLLKCNYDTSDSSEFVLGGESTREEMCLSFPTYYPRPADGDILSHCISFPDISSSFNDFLVYLSTADPEAAMQLATSEDFQSSVDTLNGLDWTRDPQLAVSLQDSVLGSTVGTFCQAENGQSHFAPASLPVPNPQCVYEAPDRCSADGMSEPLTCCQKLAAGAPSQTQISVGLIALLLSVTVLV